jgi:AcrR family transcriptional regulator
MSMSTLPEPPRLPRRPAAKPRRSGLSREAIIAAAIAELDESGAAGLSMRRIAERLGTGAASLYAYVLGKDELLELVFDELIGQVAVPVPDPTRWREQLITTLTDLHTVLASHRDAALAGLGRVPTTPHALRGAEALVAVMRSGGLSDEVAALGLDQLMLFVTASAFEQSLYDHGGMTEAEVSDYFAQVHAFYRALPADRFPALSSIADDLTRHDGDARLRFGLEVLVAGLEALSARPRPVP